MNDKRCIATWVDTWSGKGSLPGWSVQRAYEWAEQASDGRIWMRVQIVADEPRYLREHPDMQELVRIYELALSALVAGSVKREVSA